VRRAAFAVLEFVVGDDARVALGVVAMLGAVAGAVRAALDPWWLVPVAVPLVLEWSLRQAPRGKTRRDFCRAGRASGKRCALTLDMR
jgi:hypothetical protein